MAEWLNAAVLKDMQVIPLGTGDPQEVPSDEAFRY
jgi:hypothetical protein